VERQARDEGVVTSGARNAHLVRHGGSATTRDDYIKVATHWRVRVAPEAGTPSSLLEKFCSELPGGKAPTGEKCLNNQTPEVVDVPAGVPAISGHVVRIPVGLGRSTAPSW